MLSIISSSRYKIDRARIKKQVADFLITHPFVKPYDLNIVFVGRNKMKSTALKYKHENEALPVLTFIYRKEETKNDKLIAEILICYPQAVIMAAHKEKTVDETVGKLIVHGIENVQNNI